MRGLRADAAVGSAGTPASARQAAGQQASGRAARGPVRSALASWWPVIACVLAEFLIGGYRISRPSFWRDEAATISGSRRPVGAVFALMSHQDAVHGPYYLLMHAVIAIGGTSETVLRLPSLIAMSLAAGCTAALARRLAAGCGLPAPAGVGVLAGLALAAVPLSTRYAQEARPYALTSLFAVAATYLLVRAAASGRWPGWAGYAAALTLTAWFNLFAVLLAVAHGASLFVARARAGADDKAEVDAPGGEQSSPDIPVAPGLPVAPGFPVGGGISGAPGFPVGAGIPVAAAALRRWLVACSVTAALVAPVAVVSLRQSAQLNWVTVPDLSTVASLIRDFAGALVAIPVIALLGLLGCVAGPGLRRGAGLTPAVIALPWLIVPPVALLAVSFADPVYVERYVVFCLPAMAVLVAAGLVWLADLVAREAHRRELPARRVRLLAAIPSVVLAVAVTSAVVGPQSAIRLPSARADNLRAVAAVLAGHERPGDAILYLPWDTALAGMAYPKPYASLRNIGLGQSPVASDTLRGLPASPRVVAGRLRGVARVWTVQWTPVLPSAAPASTGGLGAAGLRLVRRWHIQSVVLSLYAKR
ncbi:MAG TPA: glycosyltransferase family 39 protein [Streptosporangiaceae bacterium]|nr:glycosyltransferase family 39 protein [Streptosporangiaceae bacterium]